MVSSKWWTESVGSIELLKSRVGLVRGIGYKMKIDHRDLRFQSRMTHDLISKFYVDISIVKIDRNICHNGYLSLQQFSSIIFISLYTKREQQRKSRKTILDDRVNSFTLKTRSYMYKTADEAFVTDGRKMHCEYTVRYKRLLH